MSAAIQPGSTAAVEAVRELANASGHALEAAVRDRLARRRGSVRADAAIECAVMFRDIERDGDLLREVVR